MYGVCERERNKDQLDMYDALVKDLYHKLKSELNQISSIYTLHKKNVLTV